MQNSLFRTLFLTAMAAGIKANYTTAAVAMNLRDVDFEIFGRVQGVFFRKHTKEQADRLGLRGWCKNTAQGTVLGHVQGPVGKMDNMMQWLRSTGSPSSQIEKAEFRNLKEIDDYTYQDFKILRD